MLVLAILATALAALPAEFLGTFQAGTGPDPGPAAAEGVIAQLPFFERGIARHRLAPVVKRCGEVEISEADGAISIRCGSRPVATDVPDGEPIRWTDEDGQVFDLSIDVDGDRIVQTFRSDEGHRTNVYRFDADGNLAIESTLDSPKLPEPVKFTSKYRREGHPGA